MAQHDYVIDNGGGATVRSDINAALQAILTSNSGTTAPTVTKPFMLWFDTTAVALKIRNAADTAWVLYSDFVTADGAVTAAKLASGAVTSPKMANAGAELGLRNRIINGAMTVWQRGTTGTIPGGGGYVRVHDMWHNFGVGGSVSRSSDAPAGFSYSTAIACNNTGPYLTQQTVESLNCSDLSGASVTVSFWYKNDAGSDALSVALYRPSVADVWSVPVQIGSTQTITSPSSSWTYYSFTFNSLPSQATLGLRVVFTRAGGTTSGGSLTGVQLEKGTTATPFEFRPHGVELSLCQRYYVGASQLTTYIYQAAGMLCTVPFELPVMMRASPTITTTGLTYTNASALSLGIGYWPSCQGQATWTCTSAGQTGFTTYYTASAEL